MGQEWTRFPRVPRDRASVSIPNRRHGSIPKRPSYPPPPGEDGVGNPPDGLRLKVGGEAHGNVVVQAFAKFVERVGGRPPSSSSLDSVQAMGLVELIQKEVSLVVSAAAVLRSCDID